MARLPARRSITASPGASSSARRTDTSAPRQSQSWCIWIRAIAACASARSGSSASARATVSRARAYPSVTGAQLKLASFAYARPSAAQASANAGSRTSACCRYPIALAVSSRVRRSRRCRACRLSRCASGSLARPFTGGRDLRRHRRARLGVRRLAQQGAAQFRHHRLRDVVLHREDVIQGPVVGLRPQVIAVGHLHQLHRDAHPVARLAYAAFQHRGDVERPAHLGDRGTLALEGERRRARRHPQAADLGHDVEQLVGEPVREVFVLLVVTAIREWQHRDRRHVVRRHGGSVGACRGRVRRRGGRFAARRCRDGVHRRH